MRRGPAFRRHAPTRANKASVAAMVVSGATDKALAAMTAETLTHGYGLKLAEAQAVLEKERERREGRTAHG